MKSSPVCVDASFVVRLVTVNDLSGKAEARMTEWLDHGRRLIAPTLLFYEVDSALHRYVVHGQLILEEASEALDAALSINLELHGDAALHHHALDLAGRLSLPAAYDAHYLALAERFEAEFWTADRKLARKVRSSIPWINLLRQ